MGDLPRLPSESGDRVAAYRDYLCLLARMQLASRWMAKIDLSGIVQQTLLDAVRSQLPQSEEELLVFLRRVLVNNLRDELRRQKRGKRDVRREISLEEAIDQSSHQLEVWLASDSSTPSVKLARADELRRLASALWNLPEDQRLVVELHHLQGLSLAETAERLNRSREATSALMYRALKRLRQHLDRLGDSK